MRQKLIPELTLSVTELNEYIDRLIRGDVFLSNVRVRGEIGSFKRQLSSGHWYFSLKDETGTVSCAMYRHMNRNVSFLPQDGMKVILTGSMSYYGKNGQIQIAVNQLRPDGEGDLWQRMEALKARLAAEGLLDPARKRPIPMYPKKVAVVTSESGAVWHDIINVAAKRNPAVQISLIPVSVQGQGAAEEIAEGIRTAQKVRDAEVIIVGRGGGSMEDLWCFNEECVARAVASSILPVVSAVGHETDFTVCDLVADIRASTPSNAAEIVVPAAKEIMDALLSVEKDLTRGARSGIDRARLTTVRLHGSLMRFEPSRRLSEIRGEIRNRKLILNHLVEERIGSSGECLRNLTGRIHNAADAGIERSKTRLTRASDKIGAISPLAVLERGYAIVSDVNGKVVTSAVEAGKNRILRIRFRDGETETERRNIDE